MGSRDIVKYLVLDRDGYETGDLYDDYYEARREAKEVGGTLEELTYTYHDSSTIEDYRPKCSSCDEVLTDTDEMREDYRGDSVDDLCEDCFEAYKEELAEDDPDMDVPFERIHDEMTR